MTYYILLKLLKWLNSTQFLSNMKHFIRSEVFNSPQMSVIVFETSQADTMLQSPEPIVRLQICFGSIESLNGSVSSHYADCEHV